MRVMHGQGRIWTRIEDKNIIDEHLFRQNL